MNRMELYVHIPFCRHKCRYCDFTSFPHMECLMHDYVAALLQEASFYSEETAEAIETVYFGGGTPSLLPASLLLRLMRGLADIFSLSHVIEWTVEANPGTLTSNWLDAALEGGMTRLSLGMQASQDHLLRFLGRIHTMEDVRSSVKLIRQAGVRNLNLDLIFGIPGQSAYHWLETLSAACSLNPEHISAYGLIPEEGTPLWQDLQAEKYFLPDPETERAMYGDLLSFLSARGFLQYEISNFARPGLSCRHNIGYWIQKPYLGLGLSAASMLGITRLHGGITYLRRTNTSRMDTYLQGVKNMKPVYTEETRVSPEEAQFETMMLGLRLNQGVSAEDFFRMHGITLESRYGDKLRKLQNDGLLMENLGRWKLTRKGMDLQNTALVELMDP